MVTLLRRARDIVVHVLMAPKRKRLDVNGHKLCNGKQKMKPDDCFRELTRISRT